MLLRIIPLLLFLQCSTSKTLQLLKESEPIATYQFYLSGEQGGRGVIFQIVYPDSIANLQVNKFMVNNTVVNHNVSYRNGQTILEGTKHYASQEPIQGEPKMKTEEPILLQSSNYQAVILLMIEGEELKLDVNNFSEKEMEVFP